MVDRYQIRALDALLVAKARMRDRKALAALVERWSPRLLGHAWRLMGDYEQAHDAVQEAWIDILKGIYRLRNDHAFPVWALRIVSRKCAKMIAKLQADRALKTELGLEGLTEPQNEIPAFEDAHSVRTAIASLPPGQRAAVALFYLEDFKVAQIAAALDVPTGTVKTRLMYARKTLRAVLEGGGNEPS